MPKVHRTSENSIQSFIEIIASGQVAKEKILVLNAIARNQPCTSRMLSKITGIERSSITRSLNTLINVNDFIKQAYSAKCIITGKTVSYYTMKDWKGDQNNAS